jgi:serine/threonine protein kinase
MTLIPGQVINNRYQIVKLLGQGGMGAVYKAWDLNMEMPRALKENFDISPEAQRQFKREAMLLGTLSHPNLPKVIDHFILPGQGQYLVMEFVDGENLDEVLHHLGGPLPEAQTLDWINQVCDALSYLHTQNSPIIHRDIKPANIKITPQGKAILVDFGIAKIFDPQLSTTIGAKAVTPGYSPLEQYGSGLHTSGVTDIYALGATLYTLLTGQIPPQAPDRNLGVALLQPRTINPLISAEVEVAILRAMAILPQDRYRNVLDFAKDLQHYQPVGLPASTLSSAIIPPTRSNLPATSGSLAPPIQSLYFPTGVSRSTWRLFAWIGGCIGVILIIFVINRAIQSPKIDVNALEPTKLLLQPSASLGKPTIAPPAVESTTAPATCTETITINFIVWTYGIEAIQDNIQNFEALNPCVEVILKDFYWLEYHDTMVGLFTAGASPEAQYGSDHWLQEWASAGWLQPLDDICPNVAEYNTELASYAKEGMTYNGKTYGLSYYADTMDFVYNEKFLKDAGFDAAPQTLDDVYNMSKAIKEKGINEYPIIMAWSQKEGAFPEAWLSMVYAQQETPPAMFDADLNPVFNQEGSSAYKVMEWLKKVYDEKLFDPASLTMAEIDQVKSMQAGAHTFTIFPQYNMAEVNRTNSGDYTGMFKIALQPGPSHATVGYVRFYSLSPKVVDAGQATVDAACNWLDYFGGKTDGTYVVVKRWAVENGLDFAQLPLFDDPDVIEAFGKWGDVPTIKAQAELARAKEGMTTWYGAWDVFARAEIHKAILGEESTMDALNNMANEWNRLKEQG